MAATAGWLLALSLLVGAASGVPPSAHAPLFKKLFGYDRQQRAQKGAYIVLIVHQASNTEMQEVIAEFRKVGIAAISAPVSQLPELIQRASAAYIAEDAATTEVLDLCATHRVLTLSGYDRLARSGQVALAVAHGHDGRPQIVVNLNRLKREGHQLPASVLQLSRVIR